MPPVSITSESAEIAATTPSTEAITGGGAPFPFSRPGARRAPCRLPGRPPRAPRARPARTASRRGRWGRWPPARAPPRVARATAAGGAAEGPRRACRASGGGRPPLDRPLAVRDADRDREGVGGVV